MNPIDTTKRVRLEGFERLEINKTVKNSKDNSTTVFAKMTVITEELHRVQQEDGVSEKMEFVPVGSTTMVLAENEARNLIANLAILFPKKDVPNKEASSSK